MSEYIVPSSEYKTIQSAIYGVESGDIISIKSGVYSESLVLRNKNITIKCDEYGSVVLDGLNGECGINILKDGNLIEGICFKNYKNGIIIEGIDNSIKYCNIESNKNAGIIFKNKENIVSFCSIDNNNCGILIESDDCKILNTSFINNKIFSIQNINNNINNINILENVIMGSKVGISIGHNESNHIYILKNVIQKCEYGVMLKGNNIQLKNNIISESALSAICINGENNIINRNDITKNVNGIIVMGANSQIIANSITLSDNYGINLLNSEGQKIEKNIIINNNNSITQFNIEQILSKNLIKFNNK